MKHYEVYLKKELRKNCKCGRCVNHNGFKTTLTTWHAVPIYKGDSLEEALDVRKQTKGSILFEEQRAWNYEQLTDQKEVKP